MTPLAHDARLPARDGSGVFQPSYYEEVLGRSVHPRILANEAHSRGARGTKALEGAVPFDVDLEKHLHRNGTRVIKFFSATLSGKNNASPARAYR